MKITKEKVLLLHQLLVQETGGADGLRDEGLLESAIESTYATFQGEELYPTKEEKAAWLAWSLISNHAFVDGNKRIGVCTMLSFLKANGINLLCTNQELIDLGLRVADGTYGYEYILGWIIRHRER